MKCFRSVPEFDIARAARNALITSVPLPSRSPVVSRVARPEEAAGHLYTGGTISGHPMP
jgi:hypothetical protein